ncbi:MAG: peptidogalycan biosysnthesis protein [Thermodesulfobacteriota bacterium]
MRGLGSSRGLRISTTGRTRNYGSFEDFLGDLRSGRRKQIKKERRALEGTGLGNKDRRKGRHKGRAHRRCMGFLHGHTFEEMGSAYLNREFFDLMWKKYRHRLVLVMAGDGERWVGGSFNIVKNNRLFGRYWGSLSRIATSILSVVSTV